VQNISVHSGTNPEFLILKHVVRIVTTLF